jgi:hypothetical protein
VFAEVELDAPEGFYEIPSLPAGTLNVTLVYGVAEGKRRLTNVHQAHYTVTVEAAETAVLDLQP